MRLPMNAAAKQTRPDDVDEPIRCAVVFKPTEAQRHKKQMLRYLVVAVAFLAVILLIAIALYYTQGNSVAIRHVSSLALQVRPSIFRF